MMPFVFDLPPIYRGCDYQQIIMHWKDGNGDPKTLSGWTPYCTTRRFDLNARILNSANGTTKIALTRAQTANLKLGMEYWDWVWLNDFTTQISGPYLSGRVEVKEPLSPLERPL
jgi:hypothetical protein